MHNVTPLFCPAMPAFPYTQATPFIRKTAQKHKNKKAHHNVNACLNCAAKARSELAFLRILTLASTLIPLRHLLYIINVTV